MKKFKNRLVSLSMFAIISLFLSLMMSAQSISEAVEARPDLILFMRNTGEKSGSTFVLDVNSREVTRLTPSWYYPTSWSPDGNRILAYHPDSNVWVASALVVLDADGQNRQLLTDNTQLNPFPGEWTPDGERIIFWANDFTLERGQPRWAIYDVPSIGGPIRRLTEYAQLAGGLTISPDGSEIAFTRDGILYTMPAQGGEPQNLNVPLQMSSILIWSPDDSQLAVVASNGEGEPGLYVITPDGSEVRLLVADMGWLNNLRWSPDSSELLFITNENTDSPSTLGIVNVETNVINTYEAGQGVLVSLTVITAAVWSPDGSQMVITGVFRNNNPYNAARNLYLLDHNMTQIQRLTNVLRLDDVVQWRPGS